ncbi:preprotein translocase subunit SecA [Aliamphritea spongicola]|nr:hypothetical protein [Aliamphritea spongicola]
MLRQSLTALHLFEKDRHYLIDEGKVVIIDEHTGRMMPDRTWEKGLHQLIEIKEGCELSAPGRHWRVSAFRIFPALSSFVRHDRYRRRSDRRTLAGICAAGGEHTYP